MLGADEGADGLPVPTGIANPEATLKDLWNGLNNPQKASANILVDSDVAVTDYEGRQLLLVHVPRADRHLRPVFVNNNPKTGTYRRNGEGDYHVTNDVYLSLVRDSMVDSVDAVLLEEFSLDDLHDETVQAYRSAFRSTRPDHPWVGLPGLPFLMRIGAVGRSERDHQLHPTRAGLLMFGEWTGNVYDFWHRASRMLTEGLPVPFRLGPDMRRIDDTPQHRAVREALTNALVHADYFGRMGVVLVRKPDRIIASNPGTLRIPPEEVEAGGVSDPRNRTLLFMLSLLDIGERAGSGYDVLREGTYSAGKPDPLLEELWEPDRVRLTLQLETNGMTEFRLPGMGGERSPLVTKLEPPRRGQADVGNDVSSDPVADQVTQSSDPVERLLSILGNEEMSITELMQRLGLDHCTNFRRNYLDPALEQGLIERTIPDKPTSSKQKYRRVKR